MCLLSAFWQPHGQNMCKDLAELCNILCIVRSLAQKPMYACCLACQPRTTKIAVCHFLFSAMLALVTFSTVFLAAEGAQTSSPYQDQLLTSMDPNPYGSDTSGDKPEAETQVQYFKTRLLECIAGLDRGFSASSNAAAQVESATLSLTGQSSPVSLSWNSGTSFYFYVALFFA